MSTLCKEPGSYSHEIQGNVTVRRLVETCPDKMATTSGHYSKGKGFGIADDSLLFMDSILSQNEMEDIKRMLEDDDKPHDDSDNSDNFTSTQMNRGLPKTRSLLSLSPIRPDGGVSLLHGNRFAAFAENDLMNCVNNKMDSLMDGTRGKGHSYFHSAAFGEKEGPLDDLIIPSGSERYVVQGSGRGTQSPYTGKGNEAAEARMGEPCLTRIYGRRRCGDYRVRARSQEQPCLT